MRALEIGPDYDGVAMTRRMLESARGVIVHSRFMEEQVRDAGFAGPLGADPARRLDSPGRPQRRIASGWGIDETTPLIGIFGFLKPYKRIAESLRAFRRLVRVEPRRQDDPGGRAASRFPARSR